MPRTKTASKKTVSDTPRVSIKKLKKKKTASEKHIEDVLIGCSKHDKNDIIFLGNLVESTLKSEFGAVLKALTAGRVSEELMLQKSSHKSSDYHIGRLSAFNDLWGDLEQYVLDKEKLTQPIETEDNSFPEQEQFYTTDTY